MAREHTSWWSSGQLRCRVLSRLGLWTRFRDRREELTKEAERKYFELGQNWNEIEYSVGREKGRIEDIIRQEILPDGMPELTPEEAELERKWCNGESLGKVEIPKGVGAVHDDCGTERPPASDEPEPERCVAQENAAEGAGQRSGVPGDQPESRPRGGPRKAQEVPKAEVPGGSGDGVDARKVRSDFDGLRCALENFRNKDNAKDLPGIWQSYMDVLRGSPKAQEAAFIEFVKVIFKRAEEQEARYRDDGRDQIELIQEVRRYGAGAGGCASRPDDPATVVGVA